MYLSLWLCVLISLCSLTVGNIRAYHYFEQKKNWTAARQFCRKHYTDLVTVNNMTELNSICTNQNGCGNAWIGLYYSFTEFTECKTQWHWSQPEQVYKEEEANWMTSEPTQEKNCVYAEKSDEQLQWKTQSCYQKSASLCYDGKGTKKYIENTDPKTWLQAQNYCRDHHTDLVSTSEMLKDPNRLNAVGSHPVGWRRWIGLFRDAWVWSDKSNSSFRNWAEDDEGKFACNINKNKCAKLGDHNKWNNVACNEEHPFICYDDHMVLVKEYKTWEEALVYCRRNHGDLAMMTDEHQQRMIQERAEMADTEFVWVGLLYACFFEEWLWVSGHWVSSDNENWENRKQRHGCDLAGAMQKNNEKWVKNNLGERYNFVCTSRC